MAQLSRPYQIGLATILVLAAVWVVLLQGHSPSSSSTQEPAPVASTSTPAPAKASSSSATAKHSSSTSGPSAPGVAGLTRAIDKARGAVSISEKNAKQLQEKSAQASSTTTTQAPAAVAPAKTVAPTKTAPAATPTVPKTPAAPSVASRVNSPSRERAVEAQLAKGKIALILFWNPKGADDVVVHRAIHQLNAGSLHIALNEAPASDIAAFGTITRGIQVYGTPTLLIVNKKGQTITLTGSEDSFAIAQAISEARHS
jgi:hypothetical protein